MRMYLSAVTTVFAFALLGFAFEVRAGELLLGAELGASKLVLEQRYRPSEYSTNDSDSMGFSAVLGYRHSSEFLLIAAVNYHYEPSLFGASDRVRVNDQSILFGYSFRVSKRFSVAPMIGYSFWKLRSKQGAFLNPGPEEELIFDGGSPQGGLQAEYRLGKSLGIHMSAYRGDFDFGDLKSYRLGLATYF